MSDSHVPGDTSDESMDTFVRDLFNASVERVEPDDNQARVFVDIVSQQTRSARRQRLLRRVMLTGMLALLAIPGQDLAMVFTEVALTELVRLDNVLVSVLLAPVNTVGGVLSLVLFTLRMVYRRLLY